MPLIESPRITTADQKAWDELARYDRLLATRLPLDDLAEHGREMIREFAAQGGCYVSTSWGKDSVVVAHMAATSGLTLPLVWVRVDKWENPDCPTVRDAFLEEYGAQVDYHEISVPASAQRWWDNNLEESSTKRTSRAGFDEAAQRFGDRHISGIRAEESRVRRISQARWKGMSARACRPIGEWSATDVFAYLHKYDLPVHPAYAMSYGGRRDRRWLRVSSLGGVRGADKGRAEWEAAYYGDIVCRC
ncbi:phosphoadenosine phosphosulfate reductase family protein [Corynebacterium striatum]|nr:phosphoadenosine phosphosulfate reductase family protein [Corynebacterium striatum]HAT1186911.1 phosphoadenosine phosphosulfate reductase family protein [Corynebacterium striatum]HAT1238634.1 phosphoadenosine phosphosulfate reductase family protein [Corynebacterium striatum]HAT1264592.1 phosphoadenosine phosphosulfate reductase family protein [Corynebacterium striatum]HAT1326379.1 phosphoadenosine phosphosulfate reductase family protein [Corynebacterium striatum]